MEVKIGVQHAPRELTVDTEESADRVTELLAEAVSADSVFSLVDTRGRRVVVPASKVAYLEFGKDVVGQVGFRS